ncbi:hypothetical protein CEUSTIGMA_g2627.t1 [Chlamydomonas eustigma]|uniref:SRR1-like domain-containing protein n=1 Tax=Chlamydomonas eustigma TaxID=1157962 RepID=A0A250WWF5_9CHLO|nr:hypothetical protein CEUSTIGMA_g2627.t1 [Chlamydomonas eustigma]|eukprot:GAX75183.1 hypothetical protein CEUSTIGMA_g2627.t1 [Chlamydomonas eustigma]
MHVASRPSLAKQFVQPGTSASERWRKARGKSFKTAHADQPRPPEMYAPVNKHEDTTTASLVQNVSNITVLGLGSLTSCSNDRYKYRLRQLALSLALSRALYQRKHHEEDMYPVVFDKDGIIASELIAVDYYDPDFNDLDRELISELGGTVVLASTSSAPQNTDNVQNTEAVKNGDSLISLQQVLPNGIAMLPIQKLQIPSPQPAWLKCEEFASSRTLFYMPCCTRQLYGKVLSSHLQAGNLQKISVLGTSFSSLAESSWLLSAAAQSTPSMSLQQRIIGSPLEAPSCDDDDEDGGDADSALKASNLLLALKDQGVLSEIPCSDFGAHGVATSIHFFSSSQLLQ